MLIGLAAKYPTAGLIAASPTGGCIPVTSRQTLIIGGGIGGLATYRELDRGGVGGAGGGRWCRVHASKGRSRPACRGFMALAGWFVVLVAAFLGGGSGVEFRHSGSWHYHCKCAVDSLTSGFIRSYLGQETCNAVDKLTRLASDR
jgi:hypothetical protein